MQEPVVVSLAEESRIVSDLIVTRAQGDVALEILEAGCGRAWNLALPGVRYRLTGVDLDAHALEARRTVVGDLEVAIVGDLRTVDLPEGTFDVIVCAYVLEHVEGAAKALQNMARWLKPGGLLVLRVPDRDSAFGLVARTTPFWFHVAVWRYIYGSREAGQPGHAPYPTSYDAILGVRAMGEFCQERGLSLARILGHSSLHASGLRRSLAVLFLRGLAVFSAGSLTADYNNLTFLIEKPPLPGAGSGQG
jgi:SAM-dependent methyltransferase